MPQNLPEQILQRIVSLSADGNSQQEVARILRVSQGCISIRPHQRKCGGSMKISMPRKDLQLLRMVRTNRFISAPRVQMQMIWRFGVVDVSSNHSDAASGCQILVSASNQMSWAHFGAQATPPWMGEEAQSVGPQTMETLYLQLSVPVLRIPQWWSVPGSP